MRRPTRHLLAALAASLLGACHGSSTVPAPLTIFAAASLSDVTQDLSAAFTRKHPIEVTFNFAGSNTLAQQIAAAPGADVFLSAERAWVESLERAHRTVPGTLRDVLGNRMVLIAHRQAATQIRLPQDLAAGPYRFLALADPEAVPAGRYARANLERLEIDGVNLWTRVVPRVVPTLDVRAALALVESDREILGIVYATDARSSESVRVVYEFPALPEVAITYSAVVIADGPQTEVGRLFVDFLLGAEAQAIARRHGFETAG